MQNHLKNKKIISQERYFEIKELAINCINNFYKNKNKLITIDYYIDKYKNYFKTNEEMLLFASMVLFPDSKKILDEYKEDNNTTKLASKYGVSLQILLIKLKSISDYENVYEDSLNIFKISDIDVLGINNKIIKTNIEINQSINMINKSRKNKN